jgi:hypothetical protein
MWKMEHYFLKNNEFPRVVPLGVRAIQRTNDGVTICGEGGARGVGHARCRNAGEWNSPGRRRVSVTPDLASPGLPCGDGSSGVSGR